MASRGSTFLLGTMLAALASRVASAQSSLSPVAPAKLTRFERAKAESLLRRQLPCLGCHTLEGNGGTLGPELATVRDRRDPVYIARMIRDPQGTVAGTRMPHTPMPPAWRALVVTYLGGDSAVRDPSAGAHLEPRDQSPRDALRALPPALRPASSAPSDSSGAKLYALFCAGCHGLRGGGDGPNAASLPVPPARHASRDAMAARTDDALYDAIAGGGAVMGRSPRMPAYGTTLAPAQIRALVRHIRSLCACSGPGWSTDGRAAPRD